MPPIPTHPDSLPVSGSEIASLPKEDRRSVKKTAQFIWDQYMGGMGRRQRHAIAWLMVRSFFRGIHYFEIDGSGGWNPIPPERGEIRAVSPVMVPMTRHIMGFLMSNDLGVSTTPVAGSSRSIYKSDRAEAILNGWITDADVALFRDEAYMTLLMEGMVGFHRYIDPFRQNVFMRHLPASEMFPIPFDATNDAETQGLIHASFVTRQWLELQDELFERQTGKKPLKRMSDKARTHNMSMNINLPMVGLGSGKGGKFDGALALTIWMKETEQTPGGEYIFMLGEEMFRQAIGKDEQGRNKTERVMPGGKIPVELAYYDKNISDWWGNGLCEALIAPQLSTNRQMTAFEKNMRANRSLTFYDTNAITVSDVQNEHSSLIGMNQGGLEEKVRVPVHHFPAQAVGGDSVAILHIAQRFADQAAGLRSGIAFGQQEGRTESGPATSLLSQNALASLVPVMKRLDRAWERTYTFVLDMLKFAWPEEKTVRVSGPNNIGRELKISREDIPPSQEVIIHSRPMLPGGRNALVSILFQLRNIPGQDGVNGSEVSSREFRQSLKELNILPPGISLADKAGSRIRTRVNLLIGDGQKPSIQPSDPATPGRLIMEQHKVAIEILKEFILDDGSWESYSQVVKSALIQQLRFHQQYANASGGPNSFDDDIENLESLQMENFLSIAEADLNTFEGDFSPERELESVT